jgi:transcriptional regulator with XRE-family HTH domain
MKGLGKHIKILRQTHRLTLSQIAHKTGIDRATLSRIENEKMSGTLDSHQKIAEALGIGLPDLYEDVLSDVQAVKEKYAKEKIETFFHSSGAVALLLTSGIFQKKMMPVLLKIQGLGCTETEEYAAGTERFIYVLKGSIEITSGKEKKMLRAGQSLYFNGSLPHFLCNPTRFEAQCLSVLTPTSP